MRSKAADCVVFDEVRGGRTSVPTLPMHDIHNARTCRLEFDDEGKLRYGLLTKAESYVIAKDG